MIEYYIEILLIHSFLINYKINPTNFFNKKVVGLN
jgi:hypothetical protein